MQIKRFEAHNMTEALRMIKKEFGPDAVILSAKTLKHGRRIFSAGGKALVEVTAATDNNSSVLKKMNFEKSEQIDYKNQPDVTDLQPFFKKKKITDALQDRFRVLKKKYNVSGEEKAALRHQNDRSIADMKAKLMAQGVNERIALDLAGEINKRLSLDKIMKDVDLKKSLTGILDKKCCISEPIRLEQGGQKIVALVGTAGVGKTTTIAKLAAIYTVKMNKRVAVMTLDKYRIGAIEQLGIYARVTGIPMESVSSKDEFMTALKKFKAYDLILIDTPGIGQREVGKLKELKNYFKNIDSALIYLTLSASTQTADLLEIVEKFKMISINACIFTKLDESVLHGNILNLIFQTKIPVSYFTNGQTVPGCMRAASAELLSEFVLNKGDMDVQFADQAEAGTDKLKPAEGSHIQPSDKYYVANKNSDIFHLPECKSVERIKQNNIIFFKSVKEAENKNFYPCRICIGEIVENYNALAEIMPRKIISSSLR